MTPTHKTRAVPRSQMLATPLPMIMGCHYTPMFSRRTRVQVLGLVDQSTDAWLDWYRRVHERDSVHDIAEAGYRLAELHFLYGFGLKAEHEDVELTRQFVQHAHEFGLLVMGYFQFFSIQEELFFLENPWARDCLQRDSKGGIRRYDYDRPALCFSHPHVRQYYLDGIELGIKHCDLDGIRLDNDYYRGCYCEICQVAFKEYLRTTYPPERARSVFGLPTLEGVSLLPADENNLYRKSRDPLWGAMVRFRQEQRQNMMRELSSHIRSLKSGAILGGNPAIARKLPESTRIHVYPPDLGETHDLVCAENGRFPARVGDEVRHQVLAYKWGQSGGYKIFASHHITDPGADRSRWPNSKECALSMCEALCFGGHVPATTWGLRMDGADGSMLYRRPEFLQALRTVTEFLDRYGSLYREATCNAELGVYYNRESLISDESLCATARDAVVQILLQNQIPFQFVDRDSDVALAGIRVLIVPDVRLVSDEQLGRLTAQAEHGAVILCGDACSHDEYFLPRNPRALRVFRDKPGVKWLGSLNVSIEEALAHASPLLETLGQLHDGTVRVEGSTFLGVDTLTNEAGEEIVHLLNYDNTKPVDVVVRWKGVEKPVAVFSPEGLGPVSEPLVTLENGWTTVSCKELDTYMVLRREGN